MIPPKPRVIWRDMLAFFSGRGRHNIFALIAAMAMPAFFVWLFVVDGRTNILPSEPVVIYAEIWRADRSDEEIIERQRELAIAADARRTARRRSFQRLADELGVDYDRGAAAESDRISRANQRLARTGDNAETTPRAETDAAER